MRSKTRNIRRATQDLDIDFIRLSLSNEACCFTFHFYALNVSGRHYFKRMR